MDKFWEWMLKLDYAEKDTEGYYIVDGMDILATPTDLMLIGYFMQYIEEIKIPKKKLLVELYEKEAKNLHYSLYETEKHKVKRITEYITGGNK